MSDFYSASLSALTSGPWADWPLLLAKLTAVLVLAWVMHLFLRDHNPRWRILLWRVASVGIATVALLAVSEPMLTISWPSVSMKGAVASSDTPPDTNTPAGPGPSVPELLAPPRDASSTPPFELGNVPVPHINNVSNSPINEEFVKSAESWPLGRGLLLIWSIGVAFGLLRLAAGIMQVQRVRRQSRPVPDWIAQEARSLFGDSKRIEPRQTDLVKAPCSVGILRNTILLPANLCDETHRDEIRAALAHEIAHFQGHDLRWNHLLHLISILLWFHPLAWRIRLAHADACDQRCDAEAARQLGDSLGYGRSLARLALTVSGRTTPVALSMARGSTVTQRITLLKKGGTMQLSSWRALTAAGLFGCLMLAVGTVGLTPTSAADDGTPNSQSETNEVKEQATSGSKENDEEAAKFPFKKKVRVVDPDGEPIAGATVEPWAIRAIGHGRWSKKGYGESEPPVLTTNADGIAVIPFPRYAISDEKVPPRELTCRVVHPDFAETMSNDVPVTPDKRDEVTTITLRPGAIVDILMEGHQVEEMTGENLYALTSSSSKNGFRKVLVDDRGILHLPRIPAEEDLIRLAYLPDDGPPVFSNMVSLSFIEGERVTLMFDMERSVSVEGALSDDVPRPVKNGRVVAEVIVYDEGVGDVTWRVWAKVKEDGSFTLDGLPRGDLQVIAICDGYMAESGEPPEFISEDKRDQGESPEFISLDKRDQSDPRPRPQVFKLEADATPITVEMTRTGGARFHVLHRGEPVEGAKVSLWPNVKWWGGGSQVYCEPLIASADMIKRPKKSRSAAESYGLFSATTQEDGTAFINSLPPGNQNFVVRHDTLEMPPSEKDPTYPYDIIKVTAGEVAEVTVRMQPQGTQPLEQRPLPSANEDEPAPAEPADEKSTEPRPDEKDNEKTSATPEPTKPLVTATIIDIHTEQPIKSGRVIPGTFLDIHETPEPIASWQSSLIREFTRGTFEWSVPRSYTGKRDKLQLRFEADGYIPALSPWIQKSEGPRSITIQMRRDPGIEGRVLQPDGKPAAGATLAVALPGRAVRLEDGKIVHADGSPVKSARDRWDNPIVGKTDGQGRYQISTEVGPALLYVVHETGIAEIDFVSLPHERTIHLREWASIDGRVVVLDKPIAGERIRGHMGRSASGYPVLFAYFNGKTDNNGRFSISKCPPWDAWIGRVFDLPNGDSTSFPRKHVSLEPGPNPVVLGGQGRTVTGKIVGLDDYENVTVSLKPDAPSPRYIENWSHRFAVQESKIGPLLFRENIRVEQDGSFRIEHVLPLPLEHYQLFIRREVPKVYEVRGLRVPEGPADEPFDAGEFDI